MKDEEREGRSYLTEVRSAPRPNREFLCAFPDDLDALLKNVDGHVGLFL